MYVDGLAEIVGLQRRTDLNNHAAWVVNLPREDGRWPVKVLPSGEQVWVRADNLALIQWGQTEGLHPRCRTEAEIFFRANTRPTPAERLSDEDREELVRIGRWGEHEGKLAWGDACRRIKALNGGEYPRSWYQEVIAGLLFPGSTEPAFRIGGGELLS